VSLARSKIAGGEEHEKAVGVLWGISVGKRSIFEERQTSQAEYDASCEALLSGGGVGSTGRDMRQLKTALDRVKDATTQWEQLLADADRELNKKAGVGGRLQLGAVAPMEVVLTARGGDSLTLGQLLQQPRHAAGLLLVVLRHFG